MKAKGDLTLNGTELTALNSLWVETDALSIKSEKGESMDEKIYEALKTDEAPRITFKLTKVKSLTKTSDGYTIEATGTLTIAGKTNTVDMTVKATVNDGGTVVFTGEHKVKMTKYDMEPPTAMLGVIKCGDDVTLKFTLTMKRG
jgi:polyisoprenoid-binding protein YceI